MTVYRPTTNTVVGSGTRTGGTVDTFLSDESDATYLTIQGNIGDSWTFTTTGPTGTWEVEPGWTLYARGKWTTGAEAPAQGFTFAGVTAALTFTSSTTTQSSVRSERLLTDSSFSVGVPGGQSATNVIYDVWAEVTRVTTPVSGVEIGF